MPLYTFICNKCEGEFERIEKHEDLRKVFACECGGELRWRGCEDIKVGRPGYQMAAVTSTGAKIPGHFGKEARKKGGYHQP